MKWSITVLVALVAICAANHVANVAQPVSFAVPAAPLSAAVKKTPCYIADECKTACETLCPTADVANCVYGQCNCGI